jgi:hypothetical protein
MATTTTMTPWWCATVRSDSTAAPTAKPSEAVATTAPAEYDGCRCPSQTSTTAVSFCCLTTTLLAMLALSLLMVLLSLSRSLWSAAAVAVVVMMTNQVVVVEVVVVVFGVVVAAAIVVGRSSADRLAAVARQCDPLTLRGGDHVSK